MRKTSEPAKSIDHDSVHGPRRVKTTKRFELWHKTKRVHDSLFQWVGKWMKSSSYETAEQAIVVGEKRLRELSSRLWDFRIVDKITQEIIWQSPDIKDSQ